jgi:hypothetical protein
VYFCVPAITSDGKRLWEDEDYNDFWRGGPDFHFVRILDVDGDGEAEVLTAGTDTFVHCISAKGYKKWTTSIGDDCAGLIAGPGCILAASRDGSVHCLDGRGNRLTRQVIGDACTALAGNGNLVCAATGDKRLVVLDFNGAIRAEGILESPATHLAWRDATCLFALLADGTALALDPSLMK